MYRPHHTYYINVEVFVCTYVRTKLSYIVPNNHQYFPILYLMLKLPILGEPGSWIIPLSESGIQYLRIWIIPVRKSGADRFNCTNLE